MLLRKKIRNRNTSFHKFNADRDNSQLKINIFGKIYWLILNIINNNLPPKNFQESKFSTFYKIKTFSKKIKKDEWKNVNPFSTPSRMFCDLFWMKINWSLIKYEIGNINIFDTGCGDGNYGAKLNSYASGINSYFGIDSVQYEEWKTLMNLQDNIKVEKFSSFDLSHKIPKGTNFFMTQSAIEHFNDDLDYFEQIKNYISKTKINTIQIHLFPTPPSLWLYLHHGIRQYNMRAIKKIINVFSNTNSYSVIYPLGGINSFKYHFKKVTFPEYYRKNKKNYRYTKTNEYFLGAKESIIKDIKNPKIKYASFCALIIHSNYKAKIF